MASLEPQASSGDSLEICGRQKTLYSTKRNEILLQKGGKIQASDENTKIHNRTNHRFTFVTIGYSLSI